MLGEVLPAASACCRPSDLRDHGLYIDDIHVVSVIEYENKPLNDRPYHQQKYDWEVTRGQYTETSFLYFGKEVLKVHNMFFMGEKSSASTTEITMFMQKSFRLLIEGKVECFLGIASSSLLLPINVRAPVSDILDVKSKK